MIHRESKQLFIVSYALDAAGQARVIPGDKLAGRYTALARHRRDPMNKVPCLTQAGAAYEVDVDSPAATELFKKPLPGWPREDAWTAQGWCCTAYAVHWVRLEANAASRATAAFRDD